MAEATTRQINIRIPEEDHQVLQAQAFLESSTIYSLVIRHLLETMDIKAIDCKLGIATGLIEATNPVLSFLEVYDAAQTLRLLKS